MSNEFSSRVLELLGRITNEESLKSAKFLLTQNYPEKGNRCYHQTCPNNSTVVLFGFSLCNDHALEVLKPVKHQIEEIFNFTQII